MSDKFYCIDINSYMTDESTFLFSAYCVLGTVLRYIVHSFNPYNNIMKMGCYKHFRVEETKAQLNSLLKVISDTAGS